jgi:hypothetical protein
MNTLLFRRAALAFALALGLSPLLAAQTDVKKEPLKTEFFKGKVVPLADALVKFGAKLDPDAAPHWLALQSDDGKVYPLIKDAGSRMFFKEPSLRNRPMRLTGRLLPGTNLLQVINVHSYQKGKLHEIYYWCEICTIRAYEAGICECCGAPYEFREVPAKE